jgi:hypothetical protein
VRCWPRARPLGGTGSGTPTTTAPAPAAAQASGQYPNAVVVLGHSGATGYDSDPKAPATDVLKKITVGAPKAKILIVSSPWSTVDNYGQVAARLPGPRAANSGTGPCDLFDPSGKPVPAHWRYLEGITLHYLGELKSVCAKFPTCRYDNDALYHMRITTDDITPSDGAHLTIAGLRKQAALEWRVLGLEH